MASTTVTVERGGGGGAAAWTVTVAVNMVLAIQTPGAVMVDVTRIVVEGVVICCYTSQITK